jgi:hypothetical protein
MERGRRSLWALSRGADAGDAQQSHITDFFSRQDGLPHHLPEPLEAKAGRRAVAWFWTSAQDVAFTDAVPFPWASIGPHHPVFRVVEGTLKVQLPPAIAALPSPPA